MEHLDGAGLARYTENPKIKRHKAMKILFLVSSMHAGGAERVAATLSSAWARHGHRVTLVPTYSGKGSLFYELDSQVRVEWLAERMGRAARTPLAPLVKLKALRGLVKEEQPDVIVSFLTNVNVMAILATRGLDVPLIVCERTNPAFSSSASPTLQRLRRWLYPRASMVTVQAEASLDAMRACVPGLQRLAVVPNPLPPNLPEPRTEHTEKRGRYRLVAMGRFVPSKRFEELIALFERLAPRFPDWDLYIWGEGPLRTQLQDGLKQKGLSDRVFLPGRTSTPWAELLASDLFVLSSEVEGFPNALIEAMALGLPCVTVDCPSGPREITRDGKDAHLVPLYDESALEAALAGLMADALERERLGATAAKSVRARYGLAQVTAQWDVLFADIQ